MSFIDDVSRKVKQKAEEWDVQAKAEKFVAENFDFRPANIIEELELLQPIYRQTTNYGHFGKAGLPWEKAAVPATV